MNLFEEYEKWRKRRKRGLNPVSLKTFMDTKYPNMDIQLLFVYIINEVSKIRRMLRETFLND